MLLGVAAMYVHDFRILMRIFYIPGLFVFAYFWLVPESTRWLLATGRTDRAIETLKRIARFNRRELSEKTIEGIGWLRVCCVFLIIEARGYKLKIWKFNWSDQIAVFNGTPSRKTTIWKSRRKPNHVPIAVHRIQIKTATTSFPLVLLPVKFITKIPSHICLLLFSVSFLFFLFDFFPLFFHGFIDVLTLQMGSLHIQLLWTEPIVYTNRWSQSVRQLCCCDEHWDSRLANVDN